ncbi:MAG: ABC transporter ATP-binding protein/permease [Treponema sp.]|jgi:ATP-binding cassette subfamily B protein|nr:ABC transporter ATP-binding protein/permease [Treponema sp.]
MAEYFETEEVTKEYDRVLVRRILSYLKPYRHLVAVTLFALLVSTLGELLVPVTQQRLVDNAIMAGFFRLDTGALDRARAAGRSGDGPGAEALRAFERLAANPRCVKIGEGLYVPRNQDTGLTGTAERELKKWKILDGEQWYAFDIRTNAEGRRVAEKYGEIFLLDGDGAAVRKKDLAGLEAGEIGAIRAGDLRAIARTAVFLAALLLLVFVFTFLQTWTANLTAQRVMKDIRLELFKKTLGQSTAFLSRHPVGRIVTRLTGDVETMDEFFNTVLVAFLKDLSIMAGVLATLFILSPKMALAVIVTLPPVLALTLISRVKARDAFRRQRIASSRVYSYLAERLAGMQVVQLFRGESKSRREFGGRNGELLAANLEEMYVFAVFRPLVEWFATLSSAVIITVGGAMVLDLSLSLGVLIAFIYLVQMFFSPVADIAEKYTLLQSAMAGGERVFRLLDTDERIPDTGKRSVEGGEGGARSRIRGLIEFEDVRFSYKEGEEVLKGLSFTVHPGETAAIVGATGAGKTTITNVLARLWDINSGVIRLDGIPLREIPLDELRRQALPVLQDVFLFSGTLADNIGLGLPLDREAVVEAAKAVHAHEFIARLPQGYDTRLSEGAANLSSGQRQLVSFARVIAHNPAVVILDEATSSIDTETEHLIQLGMKRVLAGRTSIVIAHRLSTIRNADRILVLSGGRVAEEGKHQELIEKNGLYAGLYRLQYGREEG